ncbi:MAG: hypothetical protein ABWW69_04610 [Pyrodictiaceae archaeon]
MRLRPLDPTHRLSRGMLTFARRARRLRLLDDLEFKPAIESSKALIVVADGEPDNRVLLALAHHVDGRKVVDVAFPEHKHSSVFNVIHEYVRGAFRGRYELILVILDQEREHLASIHNEAKQRIQLPIGEEEVDPELRGRLIYLRIPEPNTTIYVVVSGTDDQRFTKHTIEDHLLRMAEEAEGLKISGMTDPKQWWRRMPRERQEVLLEMLAADKKLAEKHFRQHVKALKTLYSLV